MAARPGTPNQASIAYLWAPLLGAQVARRAEPQLAGRPLALLDAQARVLAADAAALAAGVSEGLSERQAAARCPTLALLSAARFPLWEAQEQLLTCLRPYTDRWQPDGLGRVYLDATPAVSDANSLRTWCQAVAAAVQAVGWQAALGATGSKFGASVAGRAAWRQAERLLVPAEQRAFLAGQPVALLPLAREALLQLRYLGIGTLGAFARLPAAGVLARFGPAGRTAQRWALGLDDRPVTPPWESPAASARLEFEPPLADGVRLLAALAAQAARLLRPLQARFQTSARLRLHVTRADGRIIPAEHTFPQPTAAVEPVRLALAGLLARLPWAGEGATEVVLTLADIADAPGQQLALFDPAENDQRSRLAAAVDRLTARFGAETFRLARLADPDHLLLERRATLVPWGGAAGQV